MEPTLYFQEKKKKRIIKDYERGGPPIQRPRYIKAIRNFGCSYFLA